MQMPGMDGLDVADAVHKQFGATAPPMVLLTSLGHTNISAISEAGIAAWLTKPVKESALYDAVVSVLGSRAVRIGRSDSAAGGVHDEAAATPGAKTIRILVAEDNAVNQKVALRMLSKLGYRADVVANGREVLDALGRAPYDIILMDCSMPEMDGFEATAAIRRLEDSRHGPVIIAMTANALQGDREKCLAAGMDDYIAKPVSQAELASHLNDWSAKLHGSAEAPAEPAVDPQRLAELVALADGDDPLWLESVLARFLEDTGSRVVRIRAAIEEHDARAVRDAAHALKGSAANIGAVPLSRLAQRLQQLADTGSLDGAFDVVAELEREAGRVRGALAVSSAGKVRTS
jgi:CheY-like chemotaxis protein